MNYRTRQKETVMAILRAAHRPLTVEQIHRMASQKLPGIGMSTVYRFLKQAVAGAEVQRVELPEVGAVYELAQQEHHHYFVCQKCAQIFPLQGCVQGIKSLLPQGSRITHHEFIAYGYCPQCG